MIEAAAGVAPFARGTLHVGKVHKDGEKMAKSTGNLMLVGDLLETVLLAGASGRRRSTGVGAGALGVPAGAARGVDGRAARPLRRGVAAGRGGGGGAGGGRRPARRPGRAAGARRRC